MIRVSGSSPGTSNLKKLLIWMKIHGLQAQKHWRGWDDNACLGVRNTSSIGAWHNSLDRRLPWYCIVYPLLQNKRRDLSTSHSGCHTAVVIQRLRNSRHCQRQISNCHEFVSYCAGYVKDFLVLFIKIKLMKSSSWLVFYWLNFKSNGRFRQNFVAFLENLNFTKNTKWK